MRTPHPLGVHFLSMAAFLFIVAQTVPPLTCLLRMRHSRRRRLLVLTITTHHHQLPPPPLSPPIHPSSKVMFAAAKLIEPDCDAIDLNLGCPQRIAHAGHFGSYLLGDQDRPLVLSIVKRLALTPVSEGGLKVPVFVKVVNFIPRYMYPFFFLLFIFMILTMLLPPSPSLSFTTTICLFFPRCVCWTRWLRVFNSWSNCVWRVPA